MLCDVPARSHRPSQQLGFVADLNARWAPACVSGAATTDIIQQYVSTIKALRDLDPAGVLLEAVGQPIKEYLKKRKVRHLPGVACGA